MSSIFRQGRIAVRSLLRTPVVTAAAVISLALGIGATTAVFSAVSAALLDGMPFNEPDELVSVFRTTPHFVNGPFAPANFLDLREQNRTLQALGAVSQESSMLKRSEGTTQVSQLAVTGEILPMLGVTPRLGRIITPEDERAEATAVALISSELFQSQFGEDPSIIGSTISLDGEQHTVIGVLPERFRIPHRTRYLVGDVWVPLRFDPERAQVRRSNWLLLLGRMNRGVSVAEVDTDLVTIMDGIAETYPEVRGESVRVGSMWQESSGPIRGPLLLMLGAVALVLLIATANVASLMLARGAQRRHEVALRTALGASRGSIVRTVLVESSVLALVGVALGLAVAWAGVAVIGTLGASLYPQLEGLGLYGRVFGFAIAVTGFVAIVSGIGPGWRISGSDPQEALRSGSARAGLARSHSRLLRGIVIAELATSAVLLIGAGLLIRAFVDLMERDPGFETDSLLTMIVQLSPDRYENLGANHAFLVPGLEAVRNLPGVENAATISLIPYMGWGNNFNTRYEGQEGDDTQLPLSESRAVTPEIFGTFGVPLLQGRLFDETDTSLEEVPPTVVVNQALVRRDFPDGDPIGKRFHAGDTTFATIVGVVSDVRNFGPIMDPRPEVYWNLLQGETSRTRFPLLIRVSGDPEAQAHAVEAALRSVDPDVAVTSVQPMTAVIANSVRQQRFFMILLGSFAVVAVILAVTGLYGVISYAVAQRTRELGIRAALGSTRTRTIRFILRDAALLAAAGLVVGAVAGAGVTRLLEGMLYGVHPLSIGVWLTALTFLLLTALTAAAVPAARAAAVDPMEAIRYE